MILWRSPNGTAPLTALLARMKSEKVDDPEFAWWEEQLDVVRLTVDYATGYVAADTTIQIDSGDALNLVPGDLLLVEAALTTSYAHEIIMVSSVTSATEFVAKRAQCGTTGAAIADNANLTKIGNVYEEGSDSPNTSQRNPTKLYNYCQIFKTAYRITETAKITRARTGDPLRNDKKRKMFDHSAALEFAFLFGKRYEATGPGGKPMRTTGGLLYMMSQAYSSAIKAYTTTPTESAFLDDVYPIWDYDTEAGNERIVFAGNGFLNSLNKLAKSATQTRINFDGVVTTFGMNLARWVLPQGTLYVRTHPLFNTHGRFTNDAVIIDPSAITYRYLRDTRLEDNIQANDADEQKGQYLTECGLEVHHLRTMKWLSNFVVP